MQASLRLIFPKDRHHDVQTSLQGFLSLIGTEPYALEEDDYWKIPNHIEWTAIFDTSSYNVSQIKETLLSAFSIPPEALTECRSHSSVEMAKCSHPNAATYPDCLFLVLYISL